MISRLALPTALLLTGTAALRAVPALIDAPGRADFQACYLTTVDPMEANLATLRRGLPVEVLGQTSNGRWWVLLRDMNDPRIIQHDGWPGGQQPLGTVNPDFVVFPQGRGPLGPPMSSPRPPARNPLSPVTSLFPQPRPGGALSGIFGIPAGPGSTPHPVGPGEAPPSISGTGAPFAGLRTEAGMTGTTFLARLGTSTGPTREQAILAAVAGGHVPAFLGNFVTVRLQGTGPSGQSHVAEVRVAPDYLAIGTDADFVRMPMYPGTAQQVADQLGCTLPRPRLVDAIWRAASYQLRPQPLPAGDQMSSNDYYRRANRRIDQEMAGRPLGALTAGGKKDIVLTNRLASRPGKVAIYGWHRTSGTAIQPLYLGHGRDYVDYSHGLRLIARDMVVDGQATTVDAVLANPEFVGLISGESPVTVTRYPDP